MKSRMHKRGFRVTNRKVGFRSGSEGPRHDPYSWEEVMLTTNGKCVSVRTCGYGLITLYVDGVRKAIGPAEKDGAAARIAAKFEKLTGVSLDLVSDLARRKADQLYDDPMGHPSMYI